MVTTNDPALAERVTMLRQQGTNKRYYHDVLGFNSRLDEMQAALLRVKLERLDDWQAKRGYIATQYDEALGVLGVETPFVRPGVTHVYHQYTIRVERRDELHEFLREHGIGSMIYYPLPLHLQKMYDDLGYAKGSLPVSEAAGHEVLSLPMYPELTEGQVERVVHTIGEFLKG